MLEFVSPVPPSVNSYLGKKVVSIKGKKPYVQVYKTSEATKFDKHLQNIIKRAMAKCDWSTPEDGKYIEAHYTLFLERKRKDADNYFKLINDALTHCGAIVDDDCLIPVVDNIYIDNKSPRIDISLKVADKVGIFKDEETYEKFISANCTSCNRYNRNCSILKSSRDNKITEEINLNELVCSAKKNKK